MIETKITKIPTPPSTKDTHNFAERADSFLEALPKFQEELNVFAGEANTLKDELNTTTEGLIANLNDKKDAGVQELEAKTQSSKTELETKLNETIESFKSKKEETEQELDKKLEDTLNSANDSLKDIQHKNENIQVFTQKLGDSQIASVFNAQGALTFKVDGDVDFSKINFSDDKRQDGELVKGKIKGYGGVISSGDSLQVVQSAPPSSDPENLSINMSSLSFENNSLSMSHYHSSNNENKLSEIHLNDDGIQINSKQKITITAPSLSVASDGSSEPKKVLLEGDVSSGGQAPSNVQIFVNSYDFFKNGTFDEVKSFESPLILSYRLPVMPVTITNLQNTLSSMNEAYPQDAIDTSNITPETLQEKIDAYNAVMQKYGKWEKMAFPPETHLEPSGYAPYFMSKENQTTPKTIEIIKNPTSGSCDFECQPPVGGSSYYSGATTRIGMNKKELILGGNTSQNYGDTTAISIHTEFDDTKSNGNPQYTIKMNAKSFIFNGRPVNL